jgi:hypothetical protein
MKIQKRKIRRRGVAVAGAVAVLAAVSTASAFQALPPGAQVNDDVAAGINPALSVNGDDPANADVVGGALTAGKVAVPWAIFRQQESGGAHDQVFSRSFAAGAWTTRGVGTVGGRSSAAPAFSGSLNFDQGQDGEAPAIDFAGAGRTVPWATWYEDTSGPGFGAENVFASRFDNTGDANQGKWIFGGQGRGLGRGPVPVPSLNIHTDQDAENPSVAGGSAADATKPGPWVAWQETTRLPVNGADQIFVSRPEGPGMANCDGVKPADGTGQMPSAGGFCFQQTGAGRVGPASADPSLNVDPTRDGIEPDITFTGKNAAGVQDGVPWVVWYETGNTNRGISGLTHSNEMVFAAKGLADATPGRGGFSWTAVGNRTSALLDPSGANHFGGCAASDTAEAGCSLNKDTAADAEDPRVAAGTMNPANATVPWVAWDEGPRGGIKQVFVARLVGGTHFELANGGAPISIGPNSSSRPDITFSGNTPYVSWREDSGGGSEKAFVGHFVNADNPTFVLDESDVSLATNAQTDVRKPISSGCTANPFNQDGAACQGSAVGTPFFLFTSQPSNVLSLFSDAYQSGTPITGGASGVGTATATVAGSVDPNGTAVKVSFQFGTTTAYGQSTAVRTLGADDAVDAFTAGLTGLPAGTTIHYRAVATSDFGALTGTDQTLKTGSPPPPPPAPPPIPGTAKAGQPHLSGTSLTDLITCAGQSSCTVVLKLTVNETRKDHKIVRISTRHKPKPEITHKVEVVGAASATIPAGQSKRLRISLNPEGRALLKTRHHLSVRFTVAQVTSGRRRQITGATVTFKTTKRHVRG